MPGRAAHRDAVVFDAFVKVSHELVVCAGDRHGHLHRLRLAPRLLRTCDYLVRSQIGQAHVHHHRIVFGQAVEPRARVALARARRGRSHGLEAEAGVVEQRGHLAVLVEAGGQPEGVGEVHAHRRGLEHRVGVVEHRAQQPHERRHAACDIAEADHLVMRHVGRVIEHGVRFDHVFIGEGEKVGRGLVDGVVQTMLRYIRHASIVPRTAARVEARGAVGQGRAAGSRRAHRTATHYSRGIAESRRWSR